MSVARISLNNFQTYCVGVMLAVTRWYKEEHKLNWIECSVLHQRDYCRPVNTNTSKDHDTTMIFSFIWASFFPIQTEYCQSVDSLYLLIDIRIEAPLYANFSQSSFWIYQPSYCPVYLCLRWIWFIIRCNVCRFRFSNEIQIKSAESCFAREWNQHCANPQLWLKYRDCLSFNINSEIWIWQNRIDHMHVLSINWNLYAKR